MIRLIITNDLHVPNVLNKKTKRKIKLQIKKLNKNDNILMGGDFIRPIEI